MCSYIHLQIVDFMSTGVVMLHSQICRRVGDITACSCQGLYYSQERKCTAAQHVFGTDAVELGGWGSPFSGRVLWCPRRGHEGRDYSSDDDTVPKSYDHSSTGGKGTHV